MKRNLLFFINTLIFPLLFSGVLYISLEEYSDTRWISYVAVMVAYAVNILCFFTAPKVKDYHVHSYTRLGVSNFYFVLSLVVGVIFIAINNASITLPLILQLVILGLEAIHLTFLFIAEDVSISSDNKASSDFEFYNKICTEFTSLMTGVSDRNTLKTLEKIYDSIRAMQPIGNFNTLNIEREIFNCTAALQSALFSRKDFSDISAEIQRLIIERNKEIKQNK